MSAAVKQCGGDSGNLMAVIKSMLLGDVIRFGNGKSIKPGGVGRYPVYGSNGIIGGADEFRYENGIIIGRVGAYCGSVVYCPEQFWASDNTLVAFPTSEKFDIKFLFYLLTDAKLSRYAGGAAQPLVTQTVLKQVEVHVPSLSLQRRIASILSAYDELIENSQRRIKILETMARTLYREWFVYFRFPGHEKIPLVASTLGDIPQGWCVTTFGELYNTGSGGTPSRARPEYFEGGTIDWVKSQELLDGFVLSTEERITERALSESSAKLFPANTVLIALYGATIGKLAILSRDAATNQACCAILPKRSAFGREFAFLTLFSSREQIIGLRLGAAQQNISQVLLKNLECLQPPDQLVNEFSVRTAPLLDGILTLQRQIHNLRCTRDLLLPRLLSGQVQLDIDTAEQQLAEVQAESLQPTSAPAVCIPTTRKTLNEPAQLRVTEAAPPAYIADKPPEINDTERIDVLCAIRALFNDGVARDRATAIRDLAHALGYQRTGTRIQDVLATDLLTAVRRGIVVNEGGMYSLGFRTLTDCTRDSLKNNFESAIGRGWINREDAVRAFARWLGFARVGKLIEDTAYSLINGLIREGRLETDGSELIRKR